MDIFHALLVLSTVFFGFMFLITLKELIEQREHTQRYKQQRNFYYEYYLEAKK